MSLQFSKYTNKILPIIKVITDGTSVTCGGESGQLIDGYWYFTKPAGNYILTASNGIISKTLHITINSINLYAYTLNLNEATLYNAGDPCTSLTGGWSTTEVFPGTRNYRVNATGSISFNSDLVYTQLVNADGNNACGNAIAMYTNNKINVSNYNSLKVTLEANGQNYYGQIEVNLGFNLSTTNQGQYAYWSPDYHQEFSLSNGGTGKYDLTRTTFTYDISSISGDYYLTVTNRVRIYSDSIYENLYKIWME